MEFAVLARPQWRSPLQGESDRSLDPRIVAAPLQELELLDLDPQALNSQLQLHGLWIVFTSPASVQAFQAQIGRHALELPYRALRFIAVGTGTRDQICRAFSSLRSEEILISSDPEKADAASTLQALDQVARQTGLDWPSQHFLVIEGQGNRATLREGLVCRKAQVVSLALYARLDVQWPEALWARLAQSAPRQAGIVITSTTVIERLVHEMKARDLDPRKFVWCTQHATIAARLDNAGFGPVRRIRLDAQSITNDLFTHGGNW